MAERKRIGYIDFLKALGLLCLLLAHVDAPRWLMQLRSFDVPLMVILSGILAEQSFQKFANQGGYFKKRFERLVLPTWVFLVFYFLLMYVVKGSPYNWKYYLKSFLFQRDGIGYVWIILIYFMCAILVPFLCRLRYDGKTVWLLVVLYVLYEVAFYFGIGVNQRLIYCTVYYAVPYGMLTILGLQYRHMHKRTKGTITIIAGAIFSILAILYGRRYGEFQLVQVAKYPPRLYYLSYAILVSFLLLIYFSGRDFGFYSNSVVQFIGSHTLWIYLWHILMLKLTERMPPYLWLVRYCLVVVISCVVTWAQNAVVDKIEQRHGGRVLSIFRG